MSVEQGVGVRLGLGEVEEKWREKEKKEENTTNLSRIFFFHFIQKSSS